MSDSGERFTDIQLTNKRLPACYGYITSKLLSLEEAIEPICNLLPELKRFARLAKRHCTYPNEHDLTKDEAAAIYLYTMDMSDETRFTRRLNETLRAENRSDVRPWFPYLKLLDSAVSKLPTFKGIVWGGTNTDVSQAFKSNEKITWWSITSCSTTVSVIQSFFGTSTQSTLFKIECVNGKSIEAYTCYPNENEIILMPGSTFQTISDPLNYDDGIHIVQLKETSDEDEQHQEAIGLPTATASAAAPVQHQMNSINTTNAINPIIDGRTIEQSGRGSDNVTVYIKTLFGQTISITNVLPTMAVIDLKVAITAKTGMLVADQRLILDGRQLQDWSTLSKLVAFHDGCVIHLVCRLTPK